MRSAAATGDELKFPFKRSWLIICPVRASPTTRIDPRKEKIRLSLTKGLAVLGFKVIFSQSNFGGEGPGWSSKATSPFSPGTNKRLPDRQLEAMGWEPRTRVHTSRPVSAV